MRFAVSGLAALMLTVAPLAAQQAAPAGAVGVMSAQADDTRTLSQTARDTGLEGMEPWVALGAGGLLLAVVIIAASQSDSKATPTTPSTPNN